MAHDFDTDPIGAVLEYAVLQQRYPEQDNVEEKRQWVKQNVRSQDIGLLGPWAGPGGTLTRTQLYNVLSIGRNAGRLRQVLDAVFRTLEGKYLLVPYARDANANTTYRVVSDQGRQLFDNDAYQEYLFGILRVVQRWRSSVFRLVNRKGDGVATAFLIAPRQIATAKHVIEEMPDFVVQSEQGHELKHSQVRLHEATGVDLAVVMLDEPVNMRAFRIADEYDLLDPVVVFGYPPIPRTNDAYLVVNRGEISAKPTLYGENREIIIVTCLLRGGNSGGPVVDVTGAVVGVVSRHLFKQVAASEQSINESLGFAAATPARHLRDFR